MKTLLTIFSLLLSLQITFAQIEISGVVLAKDRGGKVGLDGASVLIKGTRIGLLTDEDGKFTLTVPSEEATLVISYLGFESKNVEVGDQKNLEIVLKKFCTICFFRPKHIGLNYFGGMKHAPVGGLIDIFLPSLIGHRDYINPQFKIGIQRNNQVNRQLYAEFGLTELVQHCDYIGSLRVIHNQLNIPESSFDFQNTRLEGQIDSHLFFRRTSSIFFGVGLSNMEKNFIEGRNLGLEFGFGQYFPLKIHAFGKVIYWTDFWQYQAGLTKKYKDFDFGFLYNRVEDYDEFNFTLGYRISLRK